MIYLSLSHSDTAEDGGLQTRLSGPKRRQEGSWFVTGVTSWEHEIKRYTMQQMVADYCVIFLLLVPKECKMTYTKCWPTFDCKTAYQPQNDITGGQLQARE